MESRVVEILRRGLAVLAIVSISCSEPDPSAPVEPLASVTESPAPATLVVDRSKIPGRIASLFSAEVVLEGSWDWNWLPGYDDTVLRVTRIGPDRFELQFVRWMCTGGSNHHTTASWSGGGLVLDDPFQRLGVLYPARFDGEDCLVPDSGLHRAGPLWKKGGDEELAFRRADEVKVEETLRRWAHPR